MSRPNAPFPFGGCGGPSVRTTHWLNWTFIQCQVRRPWNFTFFISDFLSSSVRLFFFAPFSETTKRIETVEEPSRLDALSSGRGANKRVAPVFRYGSEGFGFKYFFQDCKSLVKMNPFSFFTIKGEIFVGIV